MKTKRSGLPDWPRGLVLDFYGTVVEEDDVPIGRICTQIAEASSLLTSPAEIGRYWGCQFSQLCYESFGDSFRTQRELELLSMRAVLERFQVDLDPEALSEVLYDYWQRPAIFPESRSVLSRCKLPVCLVSNIDNADLRSALHHTALTFDHVVTSEDSRAYKPRPEIFEKAFAVLNMSPRDVLCVGDSLGCDVRGAKTAGIPVLWINRKHRPVPPGDQAPDYVSNNLTGLLSVLNGTDSS